MSKISTRRTKRVKNLIGIGALSAIVLLVASFAWFVGMQSVNVASFDVEIAATDSLLLSFDGESWNTTVAISKNTVDDVSYANHTNNWAGRGLIPMSTIGEMDVAASRMKLYEKASLTATPDGTAGGFRLMASRVPNYAVGAPERDGYVVFDLFIKNFTGTQYKEPLNILEEEAIYLTADSSAVIALDGVKDTGIENSVRVAFAQIGRVSGFESDTTKITSISCNPDANNKPSVSNNITGICRTAQIWEPNDTDHVANAIAWYEEACLMRVGEDITTTDAYDEDTACSKVIDGRSYSTYAVRDDIGSGDNIDIYDGEDYNMYEVEYDEEDEDAEVPKLFPYPYFTDTFKFYRGTNRPAFMTLSPNSITKVRVYVYIEGQDIDNYDFASIGRKISINFGFTKQRFIEGDIGYGENDDDPDINMGLGPDGADKTPPVIKLLNAAKEIINTEMETITKGTVYTDPGAVANDNIDGDITEDIVAHGVVNTAYTGTYRITYSVVDAAGNMGHKVRTIIVEE